MKKDAFWFPHDANARGDLKCLHLRRLHGMAGFGTYWAVVEMLREAGPGVGYRLPLSSAEDICHHLGVEIAVFRSLIDCELLVEENGEFSSPSLIRRMGVRDEIRSKLQSAGARGGSKRAGRLEPVLPLRQEKPIEEKFAEEGKDAAPSAPGSKFIYIPTQLDILKVLDRGSGCFSPIEAAIAAELVEGGATLEDFSAAFQRTIDRGEPKNKLSYLQDLVREQVTKRTKKSKARSNHAIAEKVHTNGLPPEADIGDVRPGGKPGASPKI